MSHYVFNFLTLPEELLSVELTSNGYHFGMPDNIGHFLHTVLSSPTREVESKLHHYTDDVRIPNEKVIVPVAIKQWNWRKANDHFTEFFNSIPKNVIHELRTNPDFFLLILNTTEPLTFSYIQHLRKTILHQVIPVNKIILCVSDHSFKQRCYNENVNLLGDENLQLNVLEVNNLFGWGLAKTSTQTKLRFKEDRQKKFISLNRRPSPHRVTLVALLEEAGYINDGFVTLRTDAFPDIKYEDIHTSEHSSWFKEDPIFRDRIANILKSMESNGKLPLAIANDIEVRDGHETSEGGPIAITNNIFKCHEESYFTILTESFFNHADSPCFMSEKTLKPMLMMHPFIMFGEHQSLHNLRRMGFQTFEPWINESYDYERDYIKRFHMAWGEVQRLASMSKSQLFDMVIQMLPALEWNRSRMIKQFDSVCQTTDYTSLLKWANVKNSNHLDIDKYVLGGDQYFPLNSHRKKTSLQQLSFDFNLIDSYISAETMTQHYNIASKQLEQYHNHIGDSSYLRSSIFLHNLFFEQLSVPDSKKVVPKELMTFILQHHETFDQFINTFEQKAKELQGAGWVCLSRDGEVRTLNNNNHEDMDILLIVDMWEHAYMLDHGQDVSSYFRSLWKIINWDVINKRLGE